MITLFFQYQHAWGGMPEPLFQSWAISPKSVLISCSHGPRNKEGDTRKTGSTGDLFHSANTPVLPLSLCLLYEFGEKNVMLAGCFRKGGEKFQSRQETSCCDEALWQGNILLRTDLENANNFTYKHLHTCTHVCIYTQISTFHNSQRWEFDGLELWAGPEPLVLWLMQI